ncbi:MAG: hypothetical protein ABIG10_03330 [bacterium]
MFAISFFGIEKIFGKQYKVYLIMLEGINYSACFELGAKPIFRDCSVISELQKEIENKIQVPKKHVEVYMYTAELNCGKTMVVNTRSETAAMSDKLRDAICDLIILLI